MKIISVTNITDPATFSVDQEVKIRFSGNIIRDALRNDLLAHVLGNDLIVELKRFAKLELSAAITQVAKNAREANDGA